MRTDKEIEDALDEADSVFRVQLLIAELLFDIRRKLYVPSRTEHSVESLKGVIPDGAFGGGTSSRGPAY